MKVKIFKPVRTAMQSGTENTKLWIMDYIEEENTRSINSLTGWTSSNNTKTQLKLKFKSKEEAIKYAQDQGFEYVVIEPKVSLLKKKSYSDNFTN